MQDKCPRIYSERKVWICIINIRMLANDTQSCLALSRTTKWTNAVEPIFMCASSQQAPKHQHVVVVTSRIVWRIGNGGTLLF